ncbi:urea amidolyase associated protein UAAP2 [Granulicoccus phenolivorans]|uniref:urea amidolyase associated protein UAAP2 n=1 Tax=Granulicoccus phenolivorans TaxID=266854 RepID=UPI0003F87B9D|nr:urea amidolyase associated protein UAAP2 [Granulicoccus phenolivorans]
MTTLIRPDFGTVLSRHTVAPRAPWSAILTAGQVLTIVDLDGNQAVDFLCYDAHDTSRAYSVQATLQGQGSVYLTEGSILRDNEYDPLLVVVANDVARQDTLGGACSKESNTLRYGHHTWHQHGCVDNFLIELSKYAMGKRDHVSNVNWFMNVPVDPDGALGIVDGISAPGLRVSLRAAKDTLVVVSNCPQINNPCNGFDPSRAEMIIQEGR